MHCGCCLLSIYTFAAEKSTIGYRELNPLTDYPVLVDTYASGIEIDSPSQGPEASANPIYMGGFVMLHR